MKNIKYFVGAVCLALSLNSCSDFLNEEPVSEIPAGDMWQTARDAKAGINEIYGLLRSTLRENYFYWGTKSARNSGKVKKSSSERAVGVSINGSSNRFFQISLPVRLFIKVYAPART